MNLVVMVWKAMTQHHNAELLEKEGASVHFLLSTEALSVLPDHKTPVN